MHPKYIWSIFKKKIVKKENVISERTGERITVNAYRLRYTLGTKLAREGYRDEIIAELLDHSSILSVGIYTENLADNAEKSIRQFLMVWHLLQMPFLVKPRLVELHLHIIAVIY